MRRLLPLSVVAILVMVGFLLLGGGGPKASPEGLPDPGQITGWGLPTVVLLSRLLGIAVVGSLMAPVLIMRALGDDLTGRGVRATRWAARLAWVWLAVVLAVIAFTVSDQLAVPVSGLGMIEVFSFAWQTNTGQALLAQAGLIVVTAVLARMALSVRMSVWGLVFAYAACLPTALTGHSAEAGGHDLAVLSLLLHVALVMTWAGGVVALIWHLGDLNSDRALRRFSPLAAWCLWITAATGVLSAWVRLGSWHSLFTTGYGWGTLAKTVVLGVIGFAALGVRRRLAQRPLPLLTFELALLGSAVALGVGLSRTPNPAGRIYVSTAEVLIGGPMPPPPTVERLLWSFTSSGAGFLVVGLGSALYIAGIVALRRRGDSWPIGRTISWFVGLLIAGWATFGGLGVYAQVLFSAHMAAHMVIGMIVPVFLVIGAPINLALRALPGSDVPGGQGPRQLLSVLMRSWFVRLISNPIFASIMFVGGLYVIYFTPIFTWLMQRHLGHAFMEIHFLIAGMVYYEVLIGTSPINRLSYLGRLLVLLAITPFHAFFGITMMSSSTPIGAEYYAALNRPWLTDLLHDNYVGGGISWGTGEVPMLLVAMMLIAQWFTSDQRQAKQFDRREAAKGDEDNELAAYNAWLEKIGKEG